MEVRRFGSAAYSTCHLAAAGAARRKSVFDSKTCRWRVE
jgi:hypothetical protein